MVKQWRLRALALLMAGLIPLAAASVTYAADNVQVTVGPAPETTTNERLEVRGVRTEGARMEILVNGRLVAAGNPAGPAWVATIPLDVGPNHIEADAILNGVKSKAETDSFRTSVTFADMATHWARAHAEILGHVGVITGTGDGNYEPNRSITRAELAKMLVLSLGLTVDPAPHVTFADAAAIPDWAKGFVATAVKSALITGYSDNTFRPDQAITRAEIAVLAARGLRLKEKTPAGEGKRFVDQAAIPAWARDDVDFASRAGVIAGYTNGRFAPAQTTTRAEAAATIRRLWQIVK